MGLARELEQPPPCFFHVGSLVKHFVAEREGLIRADDQRAGKPFAHLLGFRLGEDPGEILGRNRGVADGFLNGALIDPRWIRLRFDTRISQHREAERACGGKNDPGCHGRTGYRVRPRSATMAAAVSSIDRRLTSIIGQLCRAQICLA